ncbi:RNA polymerase sigma factor [Sedimenticola selenatireducens]|uniref:RNA polymerase sigma factor n=1 Tax=Sedimenticola selenatireducens TaxID=191960 RepID=UPI00048CFBC3|nr:RNA polymerase sigma factor [Sedimenticola selenatireducens]
MFTTWRTASKNRQRLAALSPRLRRLALAWCGEQSLAEDLSQEALARALSRLDTLKDDKALERWVFSILANCFRDHCRRHKPADQFEECIDQSLSSADEQLAQQQTTNQVRQAIGRLTPDQREVLMLVDLEACSYTEVADILDIPVGTVMSRLSRARQNLKQLITPAHGNKPGNRPFLERVK